MDKLKNSNSLLYFSNTDQIIGVTINNGRVKINYKDVDFKILSKFITKYDIEEFIQFNELNEKLIIKYSIKHKSGCLSKNVDKYIAFITFNNDLEHKATYKLTLYDIHTIGVYTEEYSYHDTYYSYFA